MATVPRVRRRRLPPVPPDGSISAITDRHNVSIPAEVFTLAGFRVWATAQDFPEHVRVTFLAGEVYLDMSNEEIETHNKVKMEIARALLTLNLEEDLGEFYGDGVLVTNEAAGVSNNPDAMFVAWETLDAGRAVLVQREGREGQYVEVEGTPDWVLEVVSVSSVQKDTVLLRRAYHRAGIPEYWLVDARGEEVLLQILHRRKGGYAVAPARGGWQHSRVFGRSFRLERQTGRRGLWRYTLHVKDD
jgi:Uma2 family endonuclease